MITWKVRGRSRSQTPEPASTPMPRARTSSIRPPAGALARRDRPVRAPRLVRERDQHQAGRADHEQEHAEVEEERGRHVQLAEERQREMRHVRGEERMAEEPGARAGCRGEQQSRGDPAQRSDGEALLGPARAPGHVLQDDADREA